MQVGLLNNEVVLEDVGEDMPEVHIVKGELSHSNVGEYIFNNVKSPAKKKDCILSLFGFAIRECNAPQVSQDQLEVIYRQRIIDFFARFCIFCGLTYWYNVQVCVMFIGGHNCFSMSEAEPNRT